MKSIKSSVKFLILSIALVTVSCDIEPIDPAIDISASSSVTGTYYMTAFNSSIPTDLNGMKKSRQAYSMLITSLRDAELRLVAHLPRGDANGVWMVLLAKYERKTLSSRHFTREKLHRLKMERGEKFDSYFARLTELEMRLKEMGAQVPADEMLFVLLEGLPPTYDFLIQALKLKEDLTLDEAVEKIRDYSDNKLVGKEAREEAAHFVKQNNGYKNNQSGQRNNFKSYANQRQENNFGNRPFICNMCAKEGHVMFNCPLIPKEAKRCYNCRQIGHVASTCRRPVRRPFEKGGGKSQLVMKEEDTAAVAKSDSDEEYVFNESEEESAHVAYVVSEEEEKKYPDPSPPVSAWSQGPPRWIMDTGTTRNLAKDRSVLTHVRRIPPVTIRVANNATETLDQGGDARLPAGEGREILLKDVVYNPNLAANLLSVVKLVDGGAEVTFKKSEATITHEGKITARVPRIGNLYIWEHHITAKSRKKETRKKKSISFCYHSEDVPVQARPASAPVAAIVVTDPSQVQVKAVPAPLPVRVSPAQLLHARMAHAGRKALKKMVVNNMVRGLKQLKLRPDGKEFNTALECDGCEYGKAHRTAFGEEMDEEFRPKAVGDVLYMDVYGPIRTADNSLCDSLGGGRYASVGVEGWSDLKFLTIMSGKDESVHHAKSIVKHIEVQTGRPLKRFHSDNGGEYRDGGLNEFLHEKGTRITSTVAHTPQHNGTAERANRTVFEKARSMLHTAGLPTSFWAEAALTVVHVLNRTPGEGGGDPSKTPYEVFYGVKPSVSHLRTFGCDVFVHVPESERGKMDPKAKKGIFIGYDEKRGNAYRVYLPGGKIVISRDCTFHENSFTGARQLEKELEVEEEREEDRFQEEREEKQRENNPFLPPKSKDRRAGRLAAHRLYQPLLTEKQFQREIKIVEDISRREEEERQKKKKQEEERQEREEQEERKGEEETTEEEEQKEQSQSVTASVLQPTTKKQNEKKKKVKLPPPPPPDPHPHARRSSRLKPQVSSTASALLAMPTPDEEKKNKNKNKNISPTPVVVVEPRSYNEAMRSSEKEKWTQAIQEELESLAKNNTFTLVPKAEMEARGRKEIGCKWIFKTKLKSDGSVDRYKARLVAKGFTQREGIDFQETFAPVMKYKSLRILLSMAAMRDWEIKQMDVQTAFLNGEIKEEVYMKVPQGVAMAPKEFEEEIKKWNERGGDGGRGRGGAGGREVDDDPKKSFGEGMVCRLNKALYGTKQASNVWHDSINSTLLSLGFHPTVSDPCVYVKMSRSGQPMWIGLFVDDLLPIHSRMDEHEWVEAKTKLMARYAMKDLGDAEWILGMKVKRDREQRRLILDQERYVEKMVKEFGMEDCKTQETPEEVGQQLTKRDEAQTAEEQQVMLSKPYMELVGSLLYASISTRPDISHAVAVLSRFMSNPGERHWVAAKRVLRYLKGTKGMGLEFIDRRSDKQKEQARESQEDACMIDIYCDADWAGDVDDRKSTSGCLILLNGCGVVWLSKKQSTVALSTAEAEYMAMSAAVQEVIWVKQLMKEMGCRVKEPMNLFCDNQAAVSLSSHTSVPHTRTKHIDIRHHYVRAAVQSRLIRVEWVRSEQQLADVFTKGLKKQTYKQLTQQFMTEQEQQQQEIKQEKI
jgi:hypothetical protein